MTSVAIVGPVSPYRGGIAQHTEMLSDALREVADRVFVCSFSRQYPKMLFPGESDKDSTKSRLQADDVEYLIDSVNPFTWRAAVRKIAAFEPDVVIFPFWTWFWAPCFGLMIRALQRRQVEVRVLCHNVSDHEVAQWKALLSKWAIKTADSYIVQASSEATRLRAIFPKAHIEVHPHPVYDQFPPPSEILPRRASLELLFYGFVRKYKGLDVLVDALSGCDVDWQLTVAGEFWEEREQIDALIKHHSLEGRIELLPRYLNDEETANVFTRADMLILPYRQATGSGVLGIALHYGKPAIASNVGSFADLVKPNKTGFLVPPGDQDALRETIQRLKRESLEDMEPAVRSLAENMTWESFARMAVRAR